MYYLCTFVLCFCTVFIVCSTWLAAGDDCYSRVCLRGARCAQMFVHVRVAYRCGLADIRARCAEVGNIRRGAPRPHRSTVAVHLQICSSCLEALCARQRSAPADSVARDGFSTQAFAPLFLRSSSGTHPRVACAYLVGNMRRGHCFPPAPARRPRPRP